MLRLTEKQKIVFGWCKRQACNSYGELIDRLIMLRPVKKERRSEEKAPDKNIYEAFIEMEDDEWAEVDGILREMY